MNPKEKFISLKDAAKISGYAPDYIGQLIRRGKISGKQMYFNVAWMTTEEAVLEYLRKSRDDESQSFPGTVGHLMRDARSNFLRYIESMKPLRLILHVTIALTIVFTLILFYILSVIVDKALNDKALQSVQDSRLTH